MKVRDLVAALSKLNEDLEVVCLTEDERLITPGRLFTLFDINSVDVADAERCRVDGAPYLKFVKSGQAEKLAVLDVTSDF
jgi:hypothetical protein